MKDAIQVNIIISIIIPIFLYRWPEGGVLGDQKQFTKIIVQNNFLGLSMLMSLLMISFAFV